MTKNRMAQIGLTVIAVVIVIAIAAGFLINNRFDQPHYTDAVLTERTCTFAEFPGGFCGEICDDGTMWSCQDMLADPPK